MTRANDQHFVEPFPPSLAAELDEYLADMAARDAPPRLDDNSPAARLAWCVQHTEAE